MKDIPVLYNNKSECCGCTACYAICPKQAISMQPDEEGFYPITNAFECYSERFDVNQTPTALRISRQVLTLPLYADLALEDVDRICQVVLKCRK